MTTELKREEFQEWMRLLRADIQGIHERLDVLNGRTRQNEQDIAVLKATTVPVIVPSSNKAAAAWGGGVGGALFLAAELLKMWTGK